jgi:transposase
LGPPYASPVEGRGVCPDCGHALVAAEHECSFPGSRAPSAWAHRRLLLAAGDRLGKHGLARLRDVLAVDDATNEIGAAWGIKELLRQLLAAPTRHDARHRLFRFYEAVPAADMPETTRLAETISTWWPAIEAFLQLRITNARTEGSNR